MFGDLGVFAFKSSNDTESLLDDCVLALIDDNDDDDGDGASNEKKTKIKVVMMKMTMMKMHMKEKNSISMFNNNIIINSHCS